ncbi:YHS domain-containing (seleno)protein [Hyphococcus formosus]|uniref:YHS domain-containing (seleno)protein n=1 Tax=Hyphococcus formosus TaxID=3143534 RepID=UPI00398AE032
MLRITKISAAAFLAAAIVQSQAFAADEYNVSSGNTLSGSPLGVHGVDTVVLSKFGAVTDGNASHAVVYDGVSYYFSTKKTAKLFEADPQSYLPQYGGFCAFAVALGKKLDGDPRYADIVDGKLYLFVNDEIFRKYKKNPGKIIKDAERKWPNIRGKSVSEL